MLIDTHCHLDPSYFPEGAEAVIARARAQGVTGFVTIGVGRDMGPVRRAAALAAERPDVWATVGVHPHDASSLDDAGFAEIEGLARAPRVVAVGEVGLDYHYMRSPRELQQEVFRRFVALARAVKKPLVIHTREAAADTLAVLEEEGARDVGGVIHCFSRGSPLRRARARPRLRPLVLGDRDLQDRAGDQGRGGVGARRPHPGRDRQPLPRARALPRQEVRAGARRVHGAPRGRAARRGARGPRRADDGERAAPVRARVATSPRWAAPARWRGAGPRRPRGRAPPAPRACPGARSASGISITVGVALASTPRRIESTPCTCRTPLTPSASVTPGGSGTVTSAVIADPVVCASRRISVPVLPAFGSSGQSASTCSGLAASEGGADQRRRTGRSKRATTPGPETRTVTWAASAGQGNDEPGDRGDVEGARGAGALDDHVGRLVAPSGPRRGARGRRGAWRGRIRSRPAPSRCTPIHAARCAASAALGRPTWTARRSAAKRMARVGAAGGEVVGELERAGGLEGELLAEAVGEGGGEDLAVAALDDGEEEAGQRLGVARSLHGLGGLRHEDVPAGLRRAVRDLGLGVDQLQPRVDRAAEPGASAGPPRVPATSTGA